MKQYSKFWKICYIIAALIFCWGGGVWLAALRYVPAVSKRVPANNNDYSAKRFEIKGQILENSKRLETGGLFFEIPPPPKIEFQSSLEILGLVRSKGKGNRAIVSRRDSSDGQTWIVKTGATVNNEKVLAIGENFIKVRNGSGSGKIYYSGTPFPEGSGSGGTNYSAKPYLSGSGSGKTNYSGKPYSSGNRSGGTNYTEEPSPDESWSGDSGYTEEPPPDENWSGDSGYTEEPPPDENWSGDSGYTEEPPPDENWSGDSGYTEEPPPDEITD